VRLRPIAELCQPERAHEFARSLTLAHLDAYLREDAQALAFLSDGAVRLLRECGVDTRQLPAATNLDRPIDRMSLTKLIQDNAA
jgi:hypothetical protein